MVYTYALTSRKYTFFNDAPFFLSRIFSPSLSLSFALSLACSLSLYACIRLACTYSINREPRYCTASPHPSALVAFTHSCISTPSSSRNALRGGSRPSPRANSPVFRSNKYQQRDSYTGSNPSLSYALINYGLKV